MRHDMSMRMGAMVNLLLCEMMATCEMAMGDYITLDDIIECH